MTIQQQLRKLLLAAALVVSLLLPASTYASDVIQRTIYVNNSPIQSTIINQNNYQMVPAIWFENLSAKVSWSTQYRSAVVSNDHASIGFPLGQSFTDYDLNGSNQWKRDNLETINFIHEGRMYVPLAYTVRKLGLLVSYDAKSQTTSIRTAANSTDTANSSRATTMATTKPSISADDLHWLNQITEAEAGGESYKGKVAVAASILNRVASPDWPKTIKHTIFQVVMIKGISYYQYSPVLDKRIYDVSPSKETIKAVQAAISGEDTSKGAVVFYNPDKTDNQWVRSRDVTVKIGNHVFAK